VVTEGDTQRCTRCGYTGAAGGGESLDPDEVSALYGNDDEMF